MQTFTINQINQNLDFLFANYGNEPLVLKNGENQRFLLMPFSSEKLQDIFLMIYKSVNQIDKQEKLNEPNRQKMTGSMFVEKWGGSLEDILIPDDWKDEYYESLNEKYK